MRAHLDVSASDHLVIEFRNSPDADWEALKNRLVEELGFRRDGTPVVGLDESIYPDFKRSNLTLAAGRDNWSGHYLLSQCASGDDFLRTLFGTLQAY